MVTNEGVGWLTEAGVAALTSDMASRTELFQALLAGNDDVMRYTAGNCFETVAFCQCLVGRLPQPDWSSQQDVQRLVVTALEQGMTWAGEQLSPGVIVGFAAVAAPGGPRVYRHVALSIGGTWIRGVNGHDLGTVWSEPADFRVVLQDVGYQGVYELDGGPVEVRFF